MKRFLIKILIAAATLAVLGWLFFAFLMPHYYLPILPFVLLFFLVVTILIHTWQFYLARKDLAKFSRISMLITFVKLVIYSAFAILYIATHDDNLLVFVLCLMLVYLVFTAVEVMELSKVVRGK